MLQSILARIKQGHNTTPFPDGDAPALPERFYGRSVIAKNKCANNCTACSDICPTNAINLEGDTTIDLGKCIFCGNCKDVCTNNAISVEQSYKLSSGTREGLISDSSKILETGEILRDEIYKLFGRSLKLRQVSAGGCNACEADINVLTTIGWDLSRFGIQIVASPRHSDGLIITGPVSQNMKLALQKTYDAVPAPKIVILVGACAISGGVYANHHETNNGADELFPVDLYIPGCPPHPLTILDGLLTLIKKNI